jgi:hypothetical protein
LIPLYLNILKALDLRAKQSYHRFMVSTVTVTTITSIAAMGLIASLCVFSVILLIGFLISKELLGASTSAKKKFIARSLNICIVPLLVSFVVLVGVKVAEILA